MINTYEREVISCNSDGSVYRKADMIKVNSGEWLRVCDVLGWLKEQSKDNPITGEELANGLAYECGMGTDYFK